MTDTKYRSYEYEDLHSMKKAGQTGGGGGNWLRDQYKRLHNTAGDLHTSAELIPDKPSQPETSDNSHLELYEWPKRLSALNESLEALQQEDIKLLSPEDQQSFSKRFKSAYAKADFASHRLLIWKAANDLAKRNSTEASDNQRAQILANATKEFNEALEGLESLKRETVKKIEKSLDNRFEDIRYFYGGLREKLADRRLMIYKTLKTDEDLLLKFTCLIEKARDGTGTYSACKLFLDTIEDEGDPILKAKYPVGYNTVSRAASNMTYVERLLVKNTANPYDQNALQVIRQKKRETLLKLVIRPTFQLLNDLKESNSYFRQAKECCEKVAKVEPQVRTSLEYMKPILERLTQSGMPANRFDQQWIDTFEDKLRSAFIEGAEGTNGQKFEELKQMASEAQQARECCEKISEVEKQVCTSLDNILECLPLSETPAHRFFGHEWWNTFEKKQLEAWHEGTLGTNGQKLEELNQFTSDVRKMGECCEKVTTVERQVRSDVSDIKSIRSSLNDAWKKDLEAQLKRINSPYFSLFTTSQFFPAALTDKVTNEFQQMLLGNAQREAAQGTNGQASAKFSHFASHIHAFKEIASSHQLTYNRIQSLFTDISNMYEISSDPIRGRSNPWSNP